jgi:hypothetical protein
MVDGKRVIFKQQVEDFAIAALDKRTANILLDMIDDCLSIPMKWQGYLDMYNKIDVDSLKRYVKSTLSHGCKFHKHRQPPHAIT